MLHYIRFRQDHTVVTSGQQASLHSTILDLDVYGWLVIGPTKEFTFHYFRFELRIYYKLK